MQTARANPVVAVIHPKHASPVKAKAKKQSVSAASVFKAKPKKPRGATRAVSSDTRVHIENAGDQRTKTRSTSRSPQKTILRHRGKRSVPHPLELDLKETTNAYRTHVYDHATTKLASIHKSLTASLDAFVGQPSASQPQTDSAYSTLAITRHVDAIAENLCKDFGGHRLCSKRTNEAGEEVEYEELLRDKMANYIEHLDKEEQELKKLQSQWEQTVGEIWKLSVQALGEDYMSKFLVTSSRAQLSPSPPKSPLKRSPEHELLGLDPASDDLPSIGVRPKKTKKSVSFVDQAQRPHFLNGPSVLSKRVPATPNFPVNEINMLEKAINELGTNEVASLKKAEKDYQAHWAKKNAEIARLFKE